MYNLLPGLTVIEASSLVKPSAVRVPSSVATVWAVPFAVSSAETSDTSTCGMR